MDFNGLSFRPFSAITRNSLKWYFAVWIWPSATDDENYHKTLCCAITEQEKRNDLMREANVRSFIIVRLKSHHGWCFAICNSILGEVYCARRLIHWLFLPLDDRSRERFSLLFMTSRHFLACTKQIDKHATEWFRDLTIASLSNHRAFDAAKMANRKFLCRAGFRS